MSTGISEWLCVIAPRGESFIMGSTYSEDQRGNLIDSLGTERLPAYVYNNGSGLFKFEPIPLSLENK